MASKTKQQTEQVATALEWRDMRNRIRAEVNDIVARWPKCTDPAKFAAWRSFLDCAPGRFYQASGAYIAQSMLDNKAASLALIAKGDEWRDKADNLRTQGETLDRDERECWQRYVDAVADKAEQFRLLGQRQFEQLPKGIEDCDPNDPGTWPVQARNTASAASKRLQQIIADTTSGRPTVFSRRAANA